MANRLGYVLITSVTLGLFVACGDGDSSNPATGGSAGDAAAGAGMAGEPTSGTGGSGTAGSANGGAGGSADGGTANVGATDPGGAAGEGGAASGGAASGGAASGGADQDGGAGGAGEPEPVNYACGTTTIVHKLCSAAFALSCVDATDCADCVTTRASERETFAECPACLAVFDKGFQCGIDAFESGHVADAFECVDDFGADLNFACYEVQAPMYDCVDYIFSNPCPETWPLP